MIMDYEIEELVSGDKYSLINFYFDFDKDVEAAAKAYADDESTASSEEWMKEFYLPYLYDYANDEVLEIVEEIIEDLDVEGEMMAFQMNEKQLAMFNLWYYSMKRVTM